MLAYDHFNDATNISRNKKYISCDILIANCYFTSNMFVSFNILFYFKIILDDPTVRMLISTYFNDATKISKNKLNI